MNSFVYWAREKDTDIVKIGASKNPSVRVKHLRRNLELVEQWPTETPYDDESAVHWLFVDQCIAGEWFQLQDSDREIVRKFFASPRKYKPVQKIACPRDECGFVWQPRMCSPKACPKCKGRLKGKWKKPDAAVSAEGEQ